MIGPIGQSIRKIRVLVGERRVLRLEQILQILGFNLIHPVGGTSVKIRGPASSPRELDDHLPQGGREEKDNVIEGPIRIWQIRRCR
jgi:hypothetical protein